MDKNYSQLKQIAIYSRKSKYTGKGESIENQIELCKQYVKLHYGLDEAKKAHVFEDEGFSGKNLDRPQFKEMMKEAKKKKISVIVCYRLDRISRNIGDFASLIEKLNELSISFISIKEQFDTSSPMGRAMMYIASVFSQLERETIAERIRDNMQELAKTGRWLGGVTPTGYTSENVETITVDGKRKKACKLSIIEEEAILVKLIYNQFLETNSLTKTESFLIQNHYHTKFNHFFSRFAIRSILTNPVYMKADEVAYSYFVQNQADLFSPKNEFNDQSGMMVYNRTLQKPGKAHEERNINEWIVSVGKHQGLISGDEWVRVQFLLGQNKNKSYRKPRSHQALLSGILSCGCCGNFMRPKLSQRLNENGNRVFDYCCSMKQRSKMALCKIDNINGCVLDQAIISQINKLTEDKAEFVHLIKKNKKNLLENDSYMDAEKQRLQKKMEEIKKELKSLVCSLAKVTNTPSEKYILDQIKEYHDTLKDLEQQCESILKKTDTQKKEVIFYDNKISCFSSMTDLMTIEQKRLLICNLVNMVVYNGKEVHIFLIGSENSFQIEKVNSD